MRTTHTVGLLSSQLVGISSIVIAQQPGSSGALARMPVKEVSIFKDGHAFVMHEGSMPTDASGNVVMDYLPAPVLGTFWAYGTDPSVKVAAVAAGQHRVVVERTALKLWEILESNIGASVIVTEKPAGAGRENLTYPATRCDRRQRNGDGTAAGYAHQRTHRPGWSHSESGHWRSFLCLQEEIAGLLAAPRPAHKIRITNSAPVPLTTAPALVVQEKRVLSQGTMLYTPSNATGDLEIGKAVDIQVVRSETEASSIANALRVGGESFSEINLTGTIKLTNYRKETVEVEVTREVMGIARSASHDGRMERLNTLAAYPSWWRYYSWPYWWNRMNGIGRVEWDVTLAPGQSVDLTYTWQYYWQ